MAQISEITIGDLQCGSRIDAEYYKPAYLENEKELRTINVVSLKEAAKDLKSFGAYALTNQFSYTEKGIPFIRCTDVKDGYVDFSEVLYIDEEANELLRKSEVKPETVLLCMSGSVGNSAITEKSWEYPINSNQDVAKIRMTDAFDPYYVTAFFNSKYGKRQIFRLPVGSVQQHIFLWQIEQLLIPKIDKDEQKKIADLIKASGTKRVEAIDLQKKAEAVLLSELGLKEYLPEHILVYETDFKSILEDRRMDAEYYQPKFQKIVEKIKEAKYDTLDSLVSYVKKGIEVGSEAYTEGGKPFIRVSNISVSGLNDNNQQVIAEELYEELRGRFEPKKGEVLLSKDGTPGIAYFVDDDVHGIISGGILRMKPEKEIEGEYLALVLNSLVVQMQIKRDAGGAIIVHWRPDQVKKTLIPILDDDKRAEIVKLVRKSTEARKESEKLLKNAKLQIETMIEQKAKVSKAA